MAFVVLGTTTLVLLSECFLRLRCGVVGSYWVML